MRRLLLLAVAMRLGAQEPANPAEADLQKTEPAKTEASPVPSTESWLTGSFDIGYRWRTDIAGSFDTYRSIVNLGSGPKLLGADFTIIDPKHVVFDRAEVRASSWGGDTYATVHLRVKKNLLYDFNADYRN